MGTTLRGSGHFVPERVVTNDELAPQLGTTPEWIEQRTGIQARRYIGDGESNTLLAAAAARTALSDAGWAPSDLDAIIVCTLSSDAVFPGVGVMVAAELGLRSTPAMDVRNQCSGFLYGLSVADAWLTSRRYQRVLLVGSEVHSTSLDYSPAGRNVTALFGDGAGAVALEWDDDEPGIIDLRLGADGTGAEMLWCEVPSARLHPSAAPEYIAQGRHFPQMQGRAVFKRAVEVLEREIGAVVAEVEELSALDEVLFIPHQANKRITELVTERVGLEQMQAVSTIEQFANTTAASIPMALDVARKDGRAHPGRLCLFAAFGSGFTWGTAVWRM